MSEFDAAYLPDVLKKAVEFHGHLGPFLVLGVQMGLLGQRVLRRNGTVIVKTGQMPPKSCVVDGLQISSGCTLGKGNMVLKGSEEVSALFKGGGGAFEIRLKDEVLAELLDDIKGTDGKDLEKLAYKIMGADVKDLFTIEEE